MEQCHPTFGTSLDHCLSHGYAIETVASFSPQCLDVQIDPCEWQHDIQSDFGSHSAGLRAAKGGGARAADAHVRLQQRRELLGHPLPRLFILRPRAFLANWYGLLLWQLKPGWIAKGFER